MSLQDSLLRISSGQHSQGRDQDVEDAVVNSFKEQFGRAPNQTEFASALPAFEAGAGSGRGFLAQMQLAQNNSPEELQKQALAKYQANPDQWNGQIGNHFQSSLGRDATDAEKQHFGALLANGTIDQYGLNQFLQTLPEYQNKQDTSFRQGLRGDLQQSNKDYYEKYLLPSIQSDFAKSGRSLDSSGFLSSAALAGQQQNNQTNQFLGNLSASQYGGNKATARSDYENYYNSLQNNQNRNYQLQDALASRTNQYSDYNQQKKAYDEYLSRYGKRQGAGNAGAIGSLAGLGIGALLAVPTGGMSIPAGAALGGAVGGAGGGIYDSYRNV